MAPRVGDKNESVKIACQDRKKKLAEDLCIYVRGLAKMFWPNTSGYIVGTYIISD